MVHLLHTFDYHVSNTCEDVFVESASCLIPFMLCWYCAIQTGVIPNRIRKCTVKPIGMTELNLCSLFNIGSYPQDVTTNGSYEDKWSRYASHWYIIISHLAPAAYINNNINFTNWPCNMPNSIMLSLSDSHLYNVICSNGVHWLLFLFAHYSEVITDFRVCTLSRSKAAAATGLWG